MKQRTITAIVAAAIFLPAAYIGHIPFAILIYAMASVSLYEILRMKHISVFSLPAFFSFVMLWIFLLPVEYIPILVHINDSVKIHLIFACILLFMTVSVISHNKFSYEEIGFCILSVFYIGIGYYYMMETRFLGTAFLFFALFLIWATDTGAYLTGRFFGKKKLSPKISPNKTVEGSIGGMISAMLVALLFYFLTDIQGVFSLGKLLILSLILSIFGQFGDLAESALKRHFNVKDSGQILPGHGGILDRVDSWLFVMPLFYFLI